MRHPYTHKSTSGVILLLAVSLGMLAVGVASPYLVYAETYSVEVDGTAYEIDYTATGIEVLKFEFDPDWRRLAATVSATSSGTLQVTLDSSILDSAYPDAVSFQILIDGDIATFTEAQDAVPPRVFTISIPAESNQLVEFIGLTSVPPSDGTVVDASSSTSVEPVSEPEQQTPEAPVPEPEAEDQTQAETEPEVPEPEPEQQTPEAPVPEPEAEDQTQAETEPKVPEPEIVAPEPEPEQQTPEAPVPEPEAPEPAAPETEGQSETAQASGCGPGTVLKDGVCILSPEPDADASTDASADAPSGQSSWIGLFYGAVMAFIVGGALAGIFGLASRRRRRDG